MPAGNTAAATYPKHIFVRAPQDNPNHEEIEVALLDLEKSRRRWRARNASRRDLHQFERHRGNIPLADVHYLYEMYQAALRQHNP